MRNFPKPGERVEADKGYRGHKDKVKCPVNGANPAEKQAMQGRVKACHKMLNRRLKNWGILYQFFCHHISLHGPGLRGGNAAHR